MRTKVVLAAAMLTACTGNIGEGGTGPSDAPPGVGKAGMRRLTVYEYDNTIHALLGDDTRPGAALLPEDARTPFDNDYTTQHASRVLVEAAETLAGDIATRLVADAARRDAVVGCVPSSIDDAGCMQSFVRTFGRRALRRPLADSEVSDYTTLGQTFATKQGDFFTGVEVVIRALLQDAEFLYRIELGTPLPSSPGVFQLSAFEKATRMSYLLWGAPPDDALLDLAASGALDSPEGLKIAAHDMLIDPRARRQVERFHALWLGYAELPHAQDLTNRMRAESAALVERVVFDDRTSWLEVFLATETYIDDTLAEHYGLTAPGSATPMWVSYAGSERQGLLSHGSFLSVVANVADTSPTKRGKLIRNRLLCQEVPPPPPDVNADEPPAADLGNCKWDRYAAHRTGSCKDCHEMMDPIGFGIENYDREGKYRTHDDGAPECTIAGDGELTGVGSFHGPAQLSQLLVGTGLLEGCAVKHLYQYAMGREVASADLRMVGALAESFAASERRLDDLLVALVAHPAFGFRREE